MLTAYPGIEHAVLQEFRNIHDVLGLARDNDKKIIIVNGGDGTLQTVLTFLKEKENLAYKPQIVLLKAGTTSMGFGDVGFKTGVRKMLNMVNQYASDNDFQIARKSRQVLRMTLPDENFSTCGMFFGAAAIYSGILYCRQNIHTKGIRGELGPSMAMFRFLFDWLTVNKLTDTVQAHVQVDQQAEIKGEFSIVAATTLHRLLAGVYPFWADKHRDQSLAISLIKQGAHAPVQSGLSILRGRAPANDSDYLSYFASSILLTIDNGFTLDGELYGEPGKPTRVILETAGPVTFLAP